MNNFQTTLAQVLAERAGQAEPAPVGVPGHEVQFYRSEATLIKSVVDFLARAVRVGQPIIVIATEAHRHAFADGLREKGLDPDEVFAGRLAVWLDARETLNAFMDGALPSRDLFMATVGSVFERILQKRHYLVVRAFGEMVDLLWKDGNTEGAVLLEQYWNELALMYKHSLLCGYSIDNFMTEAGSAGFRRVCDHHTSARMIDLPQQNVA